MGVVGAIAGGAQAGSKMVGSILGGLSQREAAIAEVRAAETSRVLEAAFFDEEVGSIIAESARLVGASEAEAGVRGVKSTTGTAAARTAEIRMAGRRELRTAAQETVLTRHGFEQASKSAERVGRSAMIQGGLGAAGAAMQGISSVTTSLSKRNMGNNQVGRL